MLCEMELNAEKPHIIDTTMHWKVNDETRQVYNRGKVNKLSESLTRGESRPGYLLDYTLNLVNFFLCSNHGGRGCKILGLAHSASVGVTFRGLLNFGTPF